MKLKLDGFVGLGSQEGSAPCNNSIVTEPIEGHGNNDVIIPLDVDSSICRSITNVVVGCVVFEGRHINLVQAVVVGRSIANQGKAGCASRIVFKLPSQELEVQVGRNLVEIDTPFFCLAD